MCPFDLDNLLEQEEDEKTPYNSLANDDQGDASRSPASKPFLLPRQDPNLDFSGKMDFGTSGDPLKDFWSGQNPRVQFTSPMEIKAAQKPGPSSVVKTAIAKKMMAKKPLGLAPNLRNSLNKAKGLPDSPPGDTPSDPNLSRTPGFSPTTIAPDVADTTAASSTSTTASAPDVSQLDKFNQDEDEFNRMNAALPDAFFHANLGEALAQAAQGPQTPQINHQFYNHANMQNLALADNQAKQASLRQTVASKIADRAQNKLIADERNQTLRDITGMKTGTAAVPKPLTEGQKALDLRFHQRRMDTMNQMLNAELQKGNSPYAVAAQTKQAISNAEALLNGSASLDDLDNRQVYETAKVVDRVLSRGNPSISGSEHLTPDTARSRLSKLMEFWSNERQGAGAGSFLESTQHTLQREKQNANQLISGVQQKIRSSYGDLEQKLPDQWAKSMKAHNLEQFSVQPPSKTPGAPVSITPSSPESKPAQKLPPPPAGKLYFREKSSGRVKALPKEQLRDILSDPDYEVVGDQP